MHTPSEVIDLKDLEAVVKLFGILRPIPGFKHYIRIILGVQFRYQTKAKFLVGNTQVIVGGGAAGYFCANSIAEFNPNIRIKLLETGSQTLRKVKISGGGRCNVTHHCFDPKILSGNYPRGQKELIGSFYRWQPRDMISWLKKKGVSLKTEEDGRIFPTSNKSQSIIDCLEQFLKSDNIQIRKNYMVRSFKKINSGKTWEVS